MSGFWPGNRFIIQNKYNITLNITCSWTNCLIVSRYCSLYFSSIFVTRTWWENLSSKSNCLCWTSCVIETSLEKPASFWWWICWHEVWIWRQLLATLFRLCRTLSLSSFDGQPGDLKIKLSDRMDKEYLISRT